MEILVLTDNEFLYDGFLKIIGGEMYSGYSFTFRYSPGNLEFEKKYNKDHFKALDVKTVLESKIDYAVIISLHSKQIFPNDLINNITCINVHPGFNPYNRGWYPHIYSIINGKPAGITIHLIDEKIDHGRIIYQEELEIYNTDTSYTIYERIINKELLILEDKLMDLIIGKYRTKPMNSKGNINYKKDFNAICKLDLNEKLTMREAINKLRALTHLDHKNAFFVDEKTKEKIYVSIQLEKDE